MDSAWRYLDLEICPGSKIRGEARSLDSGWPAHEVLGNWYNCSPCVFEPLLSFFLGLGNSESWKVETAITLPVLHVCTFPATRKALATLQGPRRAQRLGQSARRCAPRANSSTPLREGGLTSASTQGASASATHRRACLLACIDVNSRACSSATHAMTQSSVPSSVDCANE